MDKHRHPTIHTHNPLWQHELQTQTPTLMTTIKKKPTTKHYPDRDHHLCRDGSKDQRLDWGNTPLPLVYVNI